MEDELGSFFAEIEEISAQQPIESDEVVPPPVLSPVAVVAASNVQVIYSKPPEIKEVFSSEPVYNYQQPEYTSGFDATTYGGYGNTVASSSSSAPSATVVNIPRQSKTFVRKAADEVWVDDTLQEWPENDFRIFVGDLAKDVTTEMLIKQFQSIKTFAKAKVIRGKDEKSKGYGFVSFLEAMDCIKAIREMNGKYLGGRPMRIKRSTWNDRNLQEVKQKEVKKRKLHESLGIA